MEKVVFEFDRFEFQHYGVNISFHNTNKCFDNLVPRVPLRPLLGAREERMKRDPGNEVDVWTLGSHHAEFCFSRDFR